MRVSGIFSQIASKNVQQQNKSYIVSRPYLSNNQSFGFRFDARKAELTELVLNEDPVFAKIISGMILKTMGPTKLASQKRDYYLYQILINGCKRKLANHPNDNGTQIFMRYFKRQQTYLNRIIEKEDKELNVA